MNQSTVAQIQRAAARGDPGAQFSLALLLDRESRHEDAVSWLRRAAGSGHTVAATVLGLRLLAGRAAPWSPQEGARFIFQAARAGGVEAAARAAVLAANGIGAPPDWGAAKDWLDRGARAGDASAAAQLRALGTEAEFLGQPLDFARLAESRPSRSLSESVRVSVIEGFASPAVCEWLMAATRNRFMPAQVTASEADGVYKNVARSNSVAGFSIADTDVIISLIRARIAHAAGVAFEQLEPTNVLRYEPGQQFAPHHDYFDPAVPHYSEMLRVAGQRVATALLYLNEGYDGGETAFPDIDFAFRGGRGDLLIFWNVTPAGDIDPLTRHAGSPPSRGEKWVLSQWIRDRPQPVA